MVVILKRDLTFGTVLVRKGEPVSLPDSQAKELISRNLALPDIVGHEKKATKENKAAHNRKTK